MATFLGKQTKIISPKWKVVKDSIKKLGTDEICRLSPIIVRESEFYPDQKWVRIVIDNVEYVDFTLDFKTSDSLNVGDIIDPHSVMVYDLEGYDERVITRLYGEKQE